MSFQMPRAPQEVRPYPLLWPPMKARTPSYERKSKRWNATWSSALKDLQNEAQAAGLHDFVLSTGRAPGGKVEDVGAVFWFMQRIGDGWAMSFYACDQFRELPENIKAVAMTLQRLRLIEEYGCYTFEQATRGAAYEALPPPETPPRKWWEVLEVAPSSPRVVVDAVYKALAKQRHPDTPTGSTAAFKELQRAYDEAKSNLER